MKEYIMHREEVSLPILSVRGMSVKLTGLRDELVEGDYSVLKALQQLLLEEGIETYLGQFLSLEDKSYSWSLNTEEDVLTLNKCNSQIGFYPM